MTKSYEELLASLKKANKVRREKMAVKAGHKDYKTYRAWLESKVLNSKPNISTNPKVIHVVDILDASTSMMGEKIQSGIEGVNKGIEELKTEGEEGIKYTYSFCKFSYPIEIYNTYICSPLKKVVPISARSGGMTALYDAIGQTAKLVSDIISPEDKVLVNIYTDGAENASRMYGAIAIREIIARPNWTVTFIGTASDVVRVRQKLGLLKSNTLIYDNTGEGLTKSLNQTRSARKEYSKKVLRNEDVSGGFYKSLK